MFQTYSYTFFAPHLQETKEPLPAQEVNTIWESCREDGVLLGKGGLYGSVCAKCSSSYIHSLMTTLSNDFFYLFVTRSSVSRLIPLLCQCGLMP